MTIIKFYLDNTEVYSADKEDYIYDKQSMMDWLCEKYLCEEEDLTLKEYYHDEESSEMFTCEYCSYTECYDFRSKQEHNDWDSYKYYGNPKRMLIQNVVPQMPVWMRETAIRVNIGCICPNCVKNLLGH